MTCTLQKEVTRCGFNLTFIYCIPTFDCGDFISLSLNIHWFAAIYFRYQDVDTEQRSITFEEPVHGDKYLRRRGSCKPREDFSHAKKVNFLYIDNVLSIYNCYFYSYVDSIYPRHLLSI